MAGGCGSGYHQLSLFEEVTCPRCGYSFQPRARRRSLSPVAHAILAKAPKRYLKGDPLPVRDIARLTGYSMAQAQCGLLELARVRQGVTREALGHFKHVYRWQPESPQVAVSAAPETVLIAKTTQGRCVSKTD